MSGRIQIRVGYTPPLHYSDVIMGEVVSQIASLTIVYSTVYSNADQRKQQSSASLAFVRGIHRWPGNSPHKGPVTRKMFPFDDVIMIQICISHFNQYSLVDSPWGKIPSWVWQEVNHWFRKLTEFDTTVILETEFHENNNNFVSHPDKHKRNWNIVSTMNVTHAARQINWTRNIASNYFNQQQPASSFTTVSNVMVLLCELRHQ